MANDLQVSPIQKVKKIKQDNKDTPMMKQYFSLKESHKDSLLFFRLGDFFEMFYDDATIASKELGLTLTSRNGTPICGIPYHTLDSYLNKLTEKGYSITIADQIGDTKGKGLTDRQVTRIVTPGTILTEYDNNYLTLL